MADAEESSPAGGEVAEGGEIKKTTSVAKAPSGTQGLATDAPGQPVVTQPTKKPHIDFWICCGLLLLFGIVCAVGFIVVKITSFPDGPDAMFKGRYRGDRGVVDPDPK